jgi:FlaA1/EpsC-like NDP-sugar epimerase
MLIQFLNKISEKYASKWLVLLFDIAIIVATFFMAYLIRFNFTIEFDFATLFKQIPYVAIIAAISLISVGSYKGVVRFTGFKDIVNLIIGANILATILICCTFVSREFFEEGNIFDISGSIIYIHLLLNILFLIGAKLFIKSLYIHITQDFQSISNVLIFGAGNSGMLTYDAIQNDTKNGVEVVGFVDDDERKIGKKINLLKVYNIEAIVADVRNRTRIDQIFNQYKPKIVFHAAAYKHVPLMENNPFEAVSVNIGGTKNVADIAVKHSVDKFVLISTDKAVNPTNVMGATKRIAELYATCLKGKGHTKFITTRFGNVLGSNGSVIPLFKKQIEKGGPLTVTHKDITRYFMTIPEACQLVLEAAAMGNGGEIFVFDMGEPIKIFNLATNMIILSGLRYPEDIDIKITGLRPGEKIYEELLADGENTKKTYHEKIMIAKSRHVDIVSVENQINKLTTINSLTQPLEIVSSIKFLIPEYISNNSTYEVLDIKK